MQIIKGRAKTPFAVWIYGHAGLGKSTFAKDAPKPLFLGAESNEEIDADKMPAPKTWDEFTAQLKWTVENAKEYKTIVIDSLDSVERLLHAKILADAKAPTMAQALGGYGKAYDRAEKMFDEDLRGPLMSMRARGQNIIVTSHVQKTSSGIDPVLLMQFDAVEPNVHKKIVNLFGDWVSCILFATGETIQHKDANSDRVFAMTTENRILYTERRAGFLAKNRYDLPFELPLEFSAFYQGYLDFYDGKLPDPGQIRTSIEGLLQGVTDDAFLKLVQKAVTDAKDDAKRLKLILDKLKTRIEGQ